MARLTSKKAGLSLAEKSGEGFFVTFEMMRDNVRGDLPNMRSPLYVSKPLLPDLRHVVPQLEQIWHSERVTNHGPFSLELERRLSEHLSVPTAMLFNNATIAIVVALKLFDLPPGSEVITTPMTFAATAHAIAWNNLKPVFADINEKDMTIDPASVEAAITQDTSAILAVHVYGCVCDDQALGAISKRYGIKLIYDAAHVFGTRINGRSVATLGDASIFSFHATKLFNTIEGGLLATPNIVDRDQIYFLRNFGIKSEEEVVAVGINGKMNEVQAAIGLLNLDIYGKELALRSKLRACYTNILRNLPGVDVLKVDCSVTQSEQYFVVRVDSEQFGRSRDDIKASLEAEGIFCRKYFYPLCTDFTPYKGQPIVTTRPRPYADIAKDQVLCLPFHSGVGPEHIEVIENTFCKRQ